MLVLRADFSPGKEHRSGFGYVRNDDVHPGVVKLIAHEQQREPKLAAGVVDTGRADGGVRNFLAEIAKATDDAHRALKGVALKAPLIDHEVPRPAWHGSARRRPTAHSFWLKWPWMGMPWGMGKRNRPPALNLKIYYGSGNSSVWRAT